MDWTTREALASKLDRYFISTEDEFIAGHLGDKVAWTWRPGELALDDTPSIDVIKYHLNYQHDFDAIALIPCTTPLRTAEDIDNAIQMLEDNPDADSVIGVTECEYVERVKRIRDGKIVDTYPEPQDGQRQNLEKCYTRSGIYVVRREKLDKLFGHENSIACVLPPERGINIDTQLDWDIAEMLLKKREGL